MVGREGRADMGVLVLGKDKGRGRGGMEGSLLCVFFCFALL